MSLLPESLPTAGKITVITSLVGMAAFLVAFLVNVGSQELPEVAAQSYTATTSITVLNIPPEWTVDAEEESESSTSTPTNSDSEVAWVATGTDANSEPYFLLVCDNSATPTPNSAVDSNSLGTAPPECASGATQWAVSTSTVSGTEARAATTTTESMPEVNDWYAWICDDVPVNPRCNSVSKQGSGSTASPFVVNYRPTFTAYENDSPKEPGEVVTFSSTSSDPSTFDGTDTVQLHVCSTNSFSTSTQTCDATTLASSSLVSADASSTYTIPIPTRDQNYAAYGFVVDRHGHTAATGGSSVQATDSVLEVANATPYVQADSVVLNNDEDLVLTVPEGETTGFELQFEVSDNNSCENAASGDEIVDYELSVFRSDVGTTSCSSASDYDPASCYTSDLPTGTWNLSCTASTTSCSGPSDMDMVYDCTFPLWYVADPTDGGATNTVHYASEWSASALGIDDDNATGTLVAGTFTRNLTSFLYFALDTLAIPYGALEPGQRTDPLAASTTIRATGNVGLDQLLAGESMCPDYTSSVTCPNSSTSTIAETYQVFATSTVSYAAAQGAGYILSSSSPVELALNVPKSIATSTQSSGQTFWGIEVPSSITLAGAYTGENTFYGKVSEPTNW